MKEITLSPVEAVVIGKMVEWALEQKEIQDISKPGSIINYVNVGKQFLGRLNYELWK